MAKLELNLGFRVPSVLPVLCNCWLKWETTDSQDQVATLAPFCRSVQLILDFVFCERQFYCCLGLAQMREGQS